MTDVKNEQAKQVAADQGMYVHSRAYVYCGHDLINEAGKQRDHGQKQWKSILKCVFLVSIHREQ